jgi:hypothetical protein
MPEARRSVLEMVGRSFRNANQNALIVGEAVSIR